MRSATPVALAALIAAGAAGCGDHEVPAAVFGERLFRDPKLSTSPFNAFSCATCHVVDAGAPAIVPGRLDPGANLAGSVGRPSWWGTYETRLLDAVNACVDLFMGGRKLTADEVPARELYAYLDANSPKPQEAAPFTIVRLATALPDLVGDPRRGENLYRKACHRCHGDAHTAKGRLTPRATVVPEDTTRVFPDNARAVVVAKIRHGRFFNIGGVMPLYSQEVLADQDIADMLSFLGL